jgi:hypothetical protein
MVRPGNIIDHIFAYLVYLKVVPKENTLFSGVNFLCLAEKVFSFKNRDEQRNSTNDSVRKARLHPSLE